MSAQHHLTEHDKRARLLKQSVEANKAVAEDYKKSLEQSEDVRRSQELQIANLNDLIKGLQNSAEQTRLEGKDEGLPEGRALGRKEMEEEMKQLHEQFDKGYYQAEEDAADQLLALQAEMKVTQHEESFMLGYNRGLDDAGVETDDERKTLVEIPPLVLAEIKVESPIVDEPAVLTEQANVDTPAAEDPFPSPPAAPTTEA